MRSGVAVGVLTATTAAWMACGPGVQELALGQLQAPTATTGPDLVTSDDALVPGDTSVTLHGCTYQIVSVVESGPLPPIYDAVVQRLASSSCRLPEASVVLGSSYAPPALSLVGKGKRLAASFTFKSTPSGSAHTQLAIVRLDPQTLAVVRSTTLAAMSPSSSQPQLGNVFSGDLSLHGNTLVVTGTKNGVIPGETGTGDNYVARYQGFFSSTTPNPAPSSVVTF